MRTNVCGNVEHLAMEPHTAAENAFDDRRIGQRDVELGGRVIADVVALDEIDAMGGPICTDELDVAVRRTVGAPTGVDERVDTRHFEHLRRKDAGQKCWGWGPG